MLLMEYDEQAHIANEKRWSYEDGEKDGLIQGIIAFVEDKLEDGISDEIIMIKLEKRFYLSRTQAEKYLNDIRDGVYNNYKEKKLSPDGIFQMPPIEADEQI